MNRTAHSACRRTHRISVMTFVVFFVMISSLSATDTPYQPAPVEQLASNSSRRGSNAEPPVPEEFVKSETDQADAVQLESPEVKPELSASDGSTDEVETEVLAEIEPAEEPDSEVDDASDLDDETEEEETSSGKPKQLSDMKLINTDTRSLRINIAETEPDSPPDQSDSLLANELSHSAMLPSEKIFAWAAPDIRYQPLYFEDVVLERYGQTPCGCELRQTAISAAHFFKSAVLLPYQMIEQDPHSCDWPLGFCRPGTDTPFVWQRHIRR